jgi:hypothetical protein
VCIDDLADANVFIRYDLIVVIGQRRVRSAKLASGSQSPDLGEVHRVSG